AAALVLDEADIREKVVRTAFSLRFGYDDTSLAMQTMARFDVVVLASDYGADTQLRVGVRRSQADAFVTAFTDNLAGRGLVSRAAV
ncbi:MAG: DUF1949 domain-containing protein, partial [Bacteroidota bacterium]